MINKLYEYYLSNPSISTDTRKIKEGDIFFALKGDNFNGNLFAEKAIDLGAQFVVIDEGEAINEHFIKVDDVLQFLQTFARHHRDQFSIPFIGITGTNGKTTSKELINAVLEKEYKVSFTQGNLNNHIGVPLTILSIPLDTDIAIIEMGASHKGNIKELCDIANPTVGVITNIGKAHLEGFRSVDGVLQTKSELYEHIKENSGVILVNAKDNVLNEKLRSLDIPPIYYNDADSQVSLIDYKCNPYLESNFSINKQTVQVNSKLFGEYNAMNICLALAIGKYFKMDTTNCIKGIESYSPSNNRSEVRETSKGNTIVLDAYNANPSSMELATKSFFSSSMDDKHALLGDMLELGNVSEEEHRKLIKSLPTKAKLFFVGSEFKKLESEFPEFSFYSTSAELKSDLEQSDIKNASILIKGSRGIKLESVLDIL